MIRQQRTLLCIVAMQMATVGVGFPVSADDTAIAAPISGDDLTAWIDERVVWRGTLPDSARTLTGPVGFRSDNLAFDLLGFSAAAGAPARPAPACPATSD